jgi:hypothetical protein
MKPAVLALIAVFITTGCSSAQNDDFSAPPMSDQEFETQAALDLEINRVQYLEPFGLAAPQVTRVHFIDGDAWVQVMAECLTAAGFPTAGDGDGINSTPPRGQEEAWNLAAYVCSAEYPIDPHQTRPLSDGQIGHIYDYLLTTAEPCLRAHGAVGLPDPPTRQYYIDHYGAEDPWPLYWELANQPGDGWEAINEACPQQPPDIFG